MLARNQYELISLTTPFITEAAKELEIPELEILIQLYDWMECADSFFTLDIEPRELANIVVSSYINDKNSNY